MALHYSSSGHNMLPKKTLGHNMLPKVFFEANILWL